MSKWLLMVAFMHREPITINGHVFKVINRIEHEDGSGHCFNVYGYNEHGVERALFVRTID